MHSIYIYSMPYIPTHMSLCCPYPSYVTIISLPLGFLLCSREKLVEVLIFSCVGKNALTHQMEEDCNPNHKPSSLQTSPVSGSLLHSSATYSQRLCVGVSHGSAQKLPQSVAYVCAKLAAPSFFQITGVRANADAQLLPPLRPFFCATVLSWIFSISGRVMRSLVTSFLSLQPAIFAPGNLVPRLLACA